MNRRIAMSALSIVAALTLMGGATYAQLSSNATGTGITFASANASLKIAKDLGGGNAGPFADTQTFDTPIHHVFPGYNQGFTFWLRNDSSESIPLTNAVSLGSYSATGVGVGDLTTNLEVGFNCTNMGVTSNTPGAITSNGLFPISVWNPGNEDLGSLGAGEYAFCTMTANVPSSVTSMLTGENVTFTATFTGTQVEPSPSSSPSSIPL